MFKTILESAKVKNPVNIKCETPFHLACKHGHYEIAKVFIQNCARKWLNSKKRF